VLGQVQHVLGDFDVLDLVEILFLAARFVRVAQQRGQEPLLQRLERDDVLPVGQHDATDGDLVHLADGLLDHREGVVPDLAVGARIVRPDQIARVDLGLLHELVDLDGASGFKRDLLELFLARSQGVIAMDGTYMSPCPL
jgi:hypothetical protein